MESPTLHARHERERQRLLPPPAAVCPVRDVLEHVGGRWPVLTLFVLASGASRFGELRRSLPGVSQRMLAQTLRALQRDGLVLRHVRTPPAVDYELTSLGRTLLVPLRHMLDWANENFPAIRAAREDYLAEMTTLVASSHASVE